MTQETHKSEKSNSEQNDTSTDSEVIRPSPSVEEKLKKIRSRKWFITIFRFDTKIQDFIERSEKWVWSKEVCPTTKKDHWHAYIEYKNARSLMSIKKEIGDAKIEKAKGRIKQAFDYIVKDGDYKTNLPYKKKKPLKLIDKLFEWQQEVIDICKTEPNDRTVNWYYSLEGSKGKTSLIKYMVIKYNALVIGGKASDIANGLKNYFEANEEYPEVVLMNLTRECKNLSYKGLEQIKDGLVVNTKYECSQHVFNSPHLFVFSNMLPDKSKLSKDRWNIKCLDKISAESF